MEHGNRLKESKIYLKNSSFINVDDNDWPQLLSIFIIQIVSLLHELEGPWVLFLQSYDSGVECGKEDRNPSEIPNPSRHL